MTGPTPGGFAYWEDLPRLIAYDERTTPTSNITTTETGVFRFDDVPIVAGHLYRMTVSNINIDGDTGLDGDNLNQIGKVALRYAYSASTGTTATTSSTQLNTWRQAIDDATNSNIVPWLNYYKATADGFLSLLWTLQRQGGEAGNIVWFCSSVDVAGFGVEDLGEYAPLVTGTVL
jgi:hypothetical protein